MLLIFEPPGTNQNIFNPLTGSPLVPFFKHAYNKLKQSGSLHRIRQKWRGMENTAKCDTASDLRPISFHKIVSLIALLCFGIWLALITLIIEKKFQPLTNMFVQGDTCETLDQCKNLELQDAL